jgi:hypothetical protein
LGKSFPSLLMEKYNYGTQFRHGVQTLFSSLRLELQLILWKHLI